MSHIAEGVLHAYLDGALDEYSASEAKSVRAHLETCAECASRLEEERRVRDAASSILAMAAPRAADPPSFEELKAYVKATRPVGRRRSIRLYRLGWAASIVLALGVGWMARGGELERTPTSQSPAETVAVPTREAPDAAESAEVAAPEPTDDRSAEVLAERARPADPLEDRQVVAAADEATDSGRGADIVADRVVEAPSAAADAALEPVEPVVVRAEEPRTVQRAAAAASVAADMPTVDSQLVAPSAAVAPPIPAPSEPALRRDVVEERARERLAAKIDVGAAAPAPVAGVRNLGASPEVAVEAEDLLAVPGVQVLSYENLVEGTSPAGVHVLQRMENGEILDVYHLSEGVDPSVLPPIEPVRNEVRAPRDGGWVVLRGRLSTEELRALLARLVPEA